MNYYIIIIIYVRIGFWIVNKFEHKYIYIYYYCMGNENGRTVKCDSGKWNVWEWNGLIIEKFVWKKL